MGADVALSGNGERDPRAFASLIDVSSDNPLNLFGFQLEDVLRTIEQRNVLICNDMGTGKTYTAIDRDRRIRLKHPGKRKTLIVAPLGTLDDPWTPKLGELMPNLPVHRIDPKNRQAFINLCRDPQGEGYYVCHWESLRLMPDLQRVQWFHIIADECHRMKTRKAQQTVAIKKLRAHYKTPMSGTAADNKPQDLWSALNWCDNKRFSSYWKFYDSLIDYITVDPDTGRPLGYRKVLGLHQKAVEGLHKTIAPWYVRRMKEDVLPDLPDKYYSQMWVDLGPQQRRAYNEMRKDMIAWVGKHEDQPMPAPIVMAQLTRLQQFATAYGEIETYTVNTRQGDEKILVPEKRQRLKLTEPSTKLDALMGILEDSDDDPLVVFSQSKQLINMVGARLTRKGITHGLLTGDTPQAIRGALVQDFQQGKIRVFAGTIAAGGVGITLTRASRVVFLDRSWSPAINRQAEDRLHRIGQANAVQVIDIMAKSTIDLGKAQQLEQKWAWLMQLLNIKP